MPQTLILYLCAALMDMSLAGLIFAMGRRAAELGATTLVVGVLGSAIFGVYAFSTLLTGPVSDRYGRRPTAITGCLCISIFALACAFTTNVLLLILLSGLIGGAMACFWPSIIAWLSDGQSGAGLLGRMVKFSVSWNTGLVIGFVISGQIFEWAPRAAFFFCSGATLLIVFLLGLPTRKSSTETSLPVTDVPVIPAGRGFRKTAWLANFAVGFATMGAVAVFPKLATTVGVAADTHGALIAISRLSALVGFVVLQKLYFWRTRLWPLWLAQLAAAGSVVIFSWADHLAWFAVAFAIGGVVSGYTFLASIYFTLEEVAEKGKGSGFHEAVVGSAMFFGPLTAGLVGNLFGLRSPYLFCAVALVVLTIAQVLLVIRRRQANKYAG